METLWDSARWKVTIDRARRWWQLHPKRRDEQRRPAEQEALRPGELVPILERVGMSAEFRVDTVTNCGRSFHRAAGAVSLLASEAARAGKHWFQSMGRCRQAFA